MRPKLVVLSALLGLALPLAAQQGEPPITPPPDHWLTLDSLAVAVGLDTPQRTAVADSYRALNAVLKQAADKRAVLWRRYQGQPRPSQQEITPEMRARFDSVRAEFEAMQDEADQWYMMIRNLLRSDQMARFDALPKPMVSRRMMMQRGP
ncbi:MAG: hypothetical protein ACREMW_10545 [Gemmatimonadales bacterium]